MTKRTSARATNNGARRVSNVNGNSENGKGDPNVARTSTLPGNRKTGENGDGLVLQDEVGEIQTFRGNNQSEVSEDDVAGKNRRSTVAEHFASQSSGDEDDAGEGTQTGLSIAEVKQKGKGGNAKHVVGQCKMNHHHNEIVRRDVKLKIFNNYKYLNNVDIKDMTTRIILDRCRVKREYLQCYMKTFMTKIKREGTRRRCATKRSVIKKYKGTRDMLRLQKMPEYRF